MGPARMRESLTTTPGIRERPRPKGDIGKPADLVPKVAHAVHCQNAADIREHDHAKASNDEGLSKRMEPAPSKGESCSQTKDEHLSLGGIQCRMRDELHVVPSRMTWVMTVTTEHVIFEKTV